MACKWRKKGFYSNEKNLLVVVIATLVNDSTLVTSSSKF